MAAVKELSAIFLFHFFLKLCLGEITVVCGKYEQSGHCDDLLYTIQLQVQQHGCRMPPRSYLRFLISFLKLYFGQIAAVSCKSDYLTSRFATFFFHNTAASASIPNIYSKDTWRQSMNLEFIMIGQLVIVKVTLPICIIQPVLNYSYLVYHCCRVQVCVMLLNKKNSVDPSFQLPMDVKQYFY